MPVVDVTVAGGPRRYPQLLRTPRHRWWRPLLGLLVAAAVLVAGGTLVVTVVTLLAGGSLTEPSDEVLDADSPLGLLANNLVLAVLIPAAVLAYVVAHRARPGGLSSVLGRTRPGLLGRCLLLAFPLVALFLAAQFLVPPVGVGEIDPPATGTLVGLLAVVALSTPLQAAAEEVGFRGYLTQAVGAWVARPAVAAVLAAAVSALLFALAHGTQNPSLFADRLAFGLVASWLVWRTGGLEAAVALHVANNVASLGWASVTGTVSDSLTVSEVEWPYAVLDVAMMVVYAVLVARWVGREAASRSPSTADPSTGPTRPGVLSPPPGLRYPGASSDTPPPAGRDSPWGMG